jgi:transcriptional regulator with XRE-family HTH domain
MPPLEEVLVRLGERIRSRRTELRLTLQQLSDRTETDPRQLRRIQRGEANISVDALLKLAAGLELEVVHLLVDELPPVPVPQPRPPRRPRGARPGPPRSPSGQLAEKLVALRDRDRLTQKDLALQSGVSLSLVRGIETGRNSPTLRSLERIAKALRVEVVELLGGKA